MLFFDVVDVEKENDGAIGGDELGHVFLHVFLESVRELGEAFTAPFVIPFDDLDAFAGLGIFCDPLADFGVGGAGRDDGFEVVAFDFSETEEDVIERAVEVILASGTGEDGAAFVESAGS